MSETSQHTKEMSAHLSVKYKKMEARQRKWLECSLWRINKKKHFSFVFLPSTLFHTSRQIYNGASVAWRHNLKATSDNGSQCPNLMLGLHQSYLFPEISLQIRNDISVACSH